MTPPVVRDADGTTDERTLILRTYAVRRRLGERAIDALEAARYYAPSAVEARIAAYREMAMLGQRRAA